MDAGLDSKAGKNEAQGSCKQLEVVKIIDRIDMESALPLQIPPASSA